MTHSFLMVGQSNMAGRGSLKAVPSIFDEHIKMQRNGLWQTMSEPINVDRPSSGVGLAASFAACWRLDNPDGDIGLIPCAEGESSLDDWAVGGSLFDNAVFQARLAQRTSELKGILWHQGENECSSPERANSYSEKFSVIINAFRHELNIPEVPLIIGALGDFLTKGVFGQYFSAYSLVNEELKNFAQTNRDCYFVSAKGLTSNPDGIHINAESQRIFGVRYYHAYRDLQHIFNPVIDETNMLTTIYNRPYTKTEQAKLLEHEFAIGNMSSDDYLQQLAALR